MHGDDFGAEPTGEEQPDLVQGPMPAARLPRLEELYDAEALATLDGWSPRDDARAADQLLPSRLVTWSRTSTMGVLAAGFAFGLREVLDPPRDEQIVIEVDADGEPHDLPIRLFLDPDDPSGSLCILRADPPPPVV